MTKTNLQSSGIFSNLRSRLIFWFLIISLIPMGIIFTINFLTERSGLKHLAEKQLLLVRGHKDRELRNWMSERFGDLRLLASNNTICGFNDFLHKKVLGTGEIKDLTTNKNNVAVLRILNGYMRNYTAYEEIFIINSAGRIVLSTKPDMIGVYKKSDPYFINPMKMMRPFVKNFYHSHTLRKKSMAISIPIYENSITTKVKGVLVARLDILNSITPLLRSTDGLGKTGETLLVDKNRKVLVSSNEIQNSSLNCRINSPVVQKVLRGETGVVETTGYNDVKVVAAYTFIPFLQAGLIVKQDLTEVERPLHERMPLFFIIIAISSILVLIAALVLAGTITAPIRSLARDVNQAGNGDLSVRYKITTQDETAVLGNTFNMMIEDLEKQFNLQKNIVFISQSIIGVDKIEKFADVIIEKLAKLASAHAAAFYLVDSNKCTLVKSIGMDVANLTSFKNDSVNKELGFVLSNKKVTYFKDIPAETHFIHKSVLGLIVPKELIAFPLIVDENVRAILFITNTTAFSHNTPFLFESMQIFLNAAFARILAHDELFHMAEARKRLNKQLLSKSDKVRAQADELRGQNLELEVQKKHLQELSRLKGEFLSNMSHELRTPLNSILALSKVMLDMDDVDGDKREYLTVVERNGGKLLELINNILELSKLESGSVMLRSAQFNVETVVKDCVDMLKPLAESKHISIKTSILKSCEILNDPNQLRCILQNLIGNAIKFTEKGGVDVNVTCANEEVEIKVIDTGSGIPDDQLPHIFDEFRQIDGSSSRKHEGTGLGLAIAKKAATLIGGTISVTSKINVGTCFTLSFPKRLDSDDDNLTQHQSTNDISSPLDAE